MIHQEDASAVWEERNVPHSAETATEMNFSDPIMIVILCISLLPC